MSTESEDRAIAVSNAIKFVATQSGNRIFSDEEFLSLSKKIYDFIFGSSKEYNFSDNRPEVKIKVEVGKSE